VQMAAPQAPFRLDLAIRGVQPMSLAEHIDLIGASAKLNG